MQIKNWRRSRGKRKITGPNNVVKKTGSEKWNLPRIKIISKMNVATKDEQPKINSGDPKDVSNKKKTKQQKLIRPRRDSQKYEISK